MCRLPCDLPSHLRSTYRAALPIISTCAVTARASTVTRALEKPFLVVLALRQHRRSPLVVNSSLGATKLNPAALGRSQDWQTAHTLSSHHSTACSGGGSFDGDLLRTFNSVLTQIYLSKATAHMMPIA
jgi:hypothetical protein